MCLLPPPILRFVVIVPPPFLPSCPAVVVVSLQGPGGQPARAAVLQGVRRASSIALLAVVARPPCAAQSMHLV
eukprot:4143948-Pyramimonas_sp.AAC.1